MNIVFKIVLVRIIVSLIFNKKKHNVIVVKNKEEMDKIFKIFNFIFKLERLSKHEGSYRFNTNKENISEKSHNVRIYTKDFERIHGQRADLILSNSIMSQEYFKVIQPSGCIYYIKNI